MKKGLSLYLKPGEKRILKEGIEITNEGLKAVRVRIVNIANEAVQIFGSGYETNFSKK